MMHALCKHTNVMRAWRLQVSELSPGYQAYHRMMSATNECRMCVHVVKQRMHPERSIKSVTCLFNATWMAAAGKSVSNVMC